MIHGNFGTKWDLEPVLNECTMRRKAAVQGSAVRCGRREGRIQHNVAAGTRGACTIPVIVPAVAALVKHNCAQRCTVHSDRLSVDRWKPPTTSCVTCQLTTGATRFINPDRTCL